MNNEQLYIDGVLMDIDDNTKITLDIKSNLFRSVADIVSNNTYTIKLPKTVHNAKIIGNSDTLAVSSSYAYQRHACRYIRGGVAIIGNGSAYILRVTATSIEVSVTWGASEVLMDLKDNSRSIANLRTTDTLPYANVNEDEDYSTALDRGYFYSFYNAFQYRENDEWQAKSYLNIAENSEIINTSQGAIVTGNGLGVTLKQDIDDSYEGYECARIKVLLGDVINISNITGEDEDIRNYAVLDEKGKIITMCPKGDGTAKEYTLTMPTDARVLIINNKKVANKELLIIRTTTTPEDVVSNTRDGLTYYLPSVSVNYILNKIKGTYGLSVVFNDDDVKENISSIVLPLVMANPGDTISNQMRAQLASTQLTFSSTGKEQLLSVQVLNSFLSEEVVNNKTVLTAQQDVSATFDIQIEYKFQTWNMQNEAWGEYDFNSLYLSIMVEDSEGNKKAYNTENRYGNDGTVQDTELDNNRYARYSMCGSGKISLKKGDKVTFYLGGQIVSDVYAEKSPDIINLVEVTYNHIAVSTDVGEVQRGSVYPIKQNLPDVSIMDFLRTLQVLTGTYIKQSNTKNTITYYSVDNVWKNRSKALDWSKRLIAQRANNAPKTLEYKYSDFGRKNTYKWKEDKTNIQNHDGSFYISNEALSGSKDIATLPFASSDDTRVPIYAPAEGQYGFDSYTPPEFKGCEPRIMRLRNDSREHNSYLTFDDSLDLESVLNSNYRNIKKTLDNAKVITEYLYLSEYEIMNFDEGIPVYLAQYGAYFAVLEIKVNNKGYSEVTMIKI